MTELSFLLELLLNHKLPRVTKEAVTARVKDVEAGFAMVPRHNANALLPSANALVPPHLVGQAPSTIAAMQRHPDLAAALEPTAPAVIAHTPAAQAAIAARQETINAALSGKPEKGRTSPRKF